VSVSGSVALPCSCRLLSHQTLLWHDRLGHPSLPSLRGMHFCLLVSGLPRSLPLLPPSPALPCLCCVEGQEGAAPHSSSFPPTPAPLQTLHMDVWSSGTVAGGAVWPRTYFVPLIQQVLGLLTSAGLTPPLLYPPPDQSPQPLQPASPLAAPSPYTEQSGCLTEPPASAGSWSPASTVRAVRTGRRVPRPRPPPVPGTHAMALRPSSVPLHVPLPPPPESSLPAVPDLEADLARAASPTVSRLLATVVTDPSFESNAASALVAKLVDFVAACHLEYATSLVAESASASPPSVGGECAIGTDVLEDRQEEFECLAATVPHLVAKLLAP
ncbi:unnamed protein product, partial [Closterium sp. NIES-53]